MYKWYEKIKYLRKYKGMTQKELAEVFGVDRATIANWEMGRRQPSVEVFQKMAEMFGVSMNYIYDMTCQATT